MTPNIHTNVSNGHTDMSNGHSGVTSRHSGMLNGNSSIGNGYHSVVNGHSTVSQSKKLISDSGGGNTVKYTDWFGSVATRRPNARPGLPMFTQPHVAQQYVSTAAPESARVPWAGEQQYVAFTVPPGMCVCPTTSSGTTRAKRKKKCKICGHKTINIRHTLTANPTFRPALSSAIYAAPANHPAIPAASSWGDWGSSPYAVAQVNPQMPSSIIATQFSDDDSSPPTPETIRSAKSIDSTVTLTREIPEMISNNPVKDIRIHYPATDSRKSIVGGSCPASAYTLMKPCTQDTLSSDTDDLSDNAVHDQMSDSLSSSPERCNNGSVAFRRFQASRSRGRRVSIISIGEDNSSNVIKIATSSPDYYSNNATASNIRSSNISKARKAEGLNNKENVDSKATMVNGHLQYHNNIKESLYINDKNSKNNSNEHKKSGGSRNHQSESLHDKFNSKRIMSNNTQLSATNNDEISRISCVDNRNSHNDEQPSHIMETFNNEECHVPATSPDILHEPFEENDLIHFSSDDEDADPSDKTNTKNNLMGSDQENIIEAKCNKSDESGTDLISANNIFDNLSVISSDKPDKILNNGVKNKSHDCHFLDLVNLENSPTEPSYGSTSILKPNRLTYSTEDTIYEEEEDTEKFRSSEEKAMVKTSRTERDFNDTTLDEEQNQLLPQIEDNSEVIIAYQPSLSELLHVKSILKKPNSLDTSSENDSDACLPTVIEFKSQPSQGKKKSVQFSRQENIAVVTIGEKDAKNRKLSSPKSTKKAASAEVSSNLIDDLKDIYSRSITNPATECDLPSENTVNNSDTEKVKMRVKLATKDPKQRNSTSGIPVADMTVRSAYTSKDWDRSDQRANRRSADSLLLEDDSSQLYQKFYDVHHSSMGKKELSRSSEQVPTSRQSKYDSNWKNMFENSQLDRHLHNVQTRKASTKSPLKVSKLPSPVRRDNNQLNAHRSSEWGMDYQSGK